ncbi:hypothetical protein [Herbidospora yilanensis]|uniref:hypothetical protein n=1 Tax=Herbidospora yilanensis TaxID=354426 RepID=UPI0012FB209B|nr:hypothetical protein [Herbidospora yilanensis]
MVVGALALEVEAVRLDDVSLPYEMISSSNRTVALHHLRHADWCTARMNVTVRGPAAELNAGPWRSMSCVVSLTERRTNTHTTTRLPMTSELGAWSGQIELHRDDHVGKAELTATLVATVDGVAGREIAGTDDHWTIDLHAHIPVKRDDLVTRWVDFNDEAHPWLRVYRTDPWVVDTSGDTPTLYLNSGFEGLRLLLESRAPADRPAKEALAGRIAMDTWNVLFDAAAQGVRDWPGGWRETVLRRMLPDMYTDRSPDDALRELSTTDAGELRSRVLHAAAKQARMSAALGAYIRAIRGRPQEEK